MNIKINIIGAPGAGKSRVANALAKELRKGIKQPDKEALKPKHPRKDVIVVDGYMDKLMKQTGMAYDYWADYPGNFQVLCARWAAEQQAEADQVDTDNGYIIVAGSIYESILYTAMKINNDMYFNRDRVAPVQIYGQISMQALGMFQALTIDHDLVFFLPYHAKMCLEKGRSYDTVIDSQLRGVAEGYFKPLITLDGTLKDKVNDAVKVISAYEEWQAEGVAVVDEQPDSGSRSISQAEPQSQAA